MRKGLNNLTINKMKVFDNDDLKYLDWITVNPEGYVLNTQRISTSSLAVLHLGYCHHVKTTTNMPEGAYTTREYIKVCSKDVGMIKKWLEENRKNFSGRFRICKTCSPLVGQQSF